MKFLFKKRNPNYVALFFIAIIIGPALGTFIFVQSMYLMGKENDIDPNFIPIFYGVVGLPSVIVAYIITIIALRTEKGLSPFAAGIIGGLGSCLVILIIMTALQDTSPGKDFIQISGIVFGIGFTCELLCFSITPERKHEKVENAE